MVGEMGMNLFCLVGLYFHVDKNIYLEIHVLSDVSLSVMYTVIIVSQVNEVFLIIVYFVLLTLELFGNTENMLSTWESY